MNHDAMRWAASPGNWLRRGRMVGLRRPAGWCVLLGWCWLMLPPECWADERYAAQVAPLLRAHCVGCHNPDNAEGGLDLSTYEGLLRGGATGLAVTPGAIPTSRLHLLASRQVEPAMPPDPAEALSEAQLQVLADWIQAGAAGPDGVGSRQTLRVPQVAVQHSKPAPITALSMSPDGTTVALGQTGSVALAKVSALRSGETLAELHQRHGLVLTGFSGKVNALSFSRDGSRLIVATGIEGMAGETQVIDLGDLMPNADPGEQWPGGKSLDLAEVPRQLFAGHRDSVYSAVMSPDGKWLATAGYDRVIKLWNLFDGQGVGELVGHNGAVFELDFTADSSALLSAAADQTVKVWDVASAARIDTLGQPEGEVFAVRFLRATPESSDSRLLAISADNRLRVWRWLPSGTPVPNPLLETRFVDESALLLLAVDPSGQRLAIATQSGNLKLLSTRTWNVLESLEPVAGTPSGLVFSADGARLWVTDLNGRIHSRATDTLGKLGLVAEVAGVTPQYLPDGEPHVLLEVAASQSLAGGGSEVPRHVAVMGTIAQPGKVDYYQWEVNAGEVWAIDVDAVGGRPQASAVHPTLPAVGDASELDPLITILDRDGRPVIRTQLQAIRESYFTFRGKDSMQSDDFRLFGQQEMRLDQFLYAAGEVTRLWMHPRGPDSGFDVYPGSGHRWTYFGTSHVTHALGEPAYIVQPLLAGQKPLDNGLPTFDIVYRNDDDPSRRAGNGSRLTFVAPRSGRFTVAVQDTRWHGRDNFHYQLRIRPARPDFQASVTPVTQGLVQGAGREFTVSVERFDDFSGPVEFTIDGLPPGVSASLPIVIEAEQRSAQGTIWIQEDQAWPESVQPVVMATADILGRPVTRSAGSLGDLRKAEQVPLVPWIVAVESPSLEPVSVADAGHSELTVQPAAFATVLRLPRGGTLSAKVRVKRVEGVTGEVSFGNALAARNPAHGVYVDNIGLNGLLLLSQMNDREFFLTADPKTSLGRRPFFLKAEIDGGLTTLPIWVEVVADDAGEAALDHR